MKNKIKRIFLRKQRGDGELFTNALTVMVLIIMMIFFVDSYIDMKTKDNLDNIARKYILILETTNTINGNNILVDIDRATGGDGLKTFDKWIGSPTITVTVEGSSGNYVTHIDEHVADIESEYGDIVTLTIDGQLKTRTGRWVSLFDASGDPATHFSVSKSSTAKH